MAPKRGTDWFVRIHRTYAEIEPWVRNLSDKIQKLVVYQHDADEEVSRTHCHLMIIGYTTSDETMKTQLTKVLGERLKGQKDWVWDPVVRSETDAITYMSKKDLQPMFVVGFDETLIAECSAKYRPKDEYVKSKEKTQFKIVAEKPEVSKKRQNDLLDEMTTRLKNLRKNEIESFPIVSALNARSDAEAFQWEQEKVLQIIIDVLNENRVIFGRYKVRDYYDTLMCRLDSKQFKNSMLGMVAYKNSFI